MRRRLYAVPAGVIDQQSPGGNFPQLVQDLIGMQGQVQQYAPALSSQWGWLAQQGQALAAGRQASITQSQWVAQYRTFFAALQGGEPDQQSMVSQQFFQNVGTDASAGFPQAGQDLQNEATGAIDATAQGFSAFGGMAAWFASNWPWVALGVGALIVVPLAISWVKDASK